MKVISNFLRTNTIYFATMMLMLLAQFSFGAEVEKNYRTLMNLLDYLGRDYVNAVDQGVVVNDFEYEEMQEFSDQTLRIFTLLIQEAQIEDSVSIHLDLHQINSAILEKEDASKILELTSGVKSKLLLLSLVENKPEQWPDLNLGKALYVKNCVSCHGESGDGKGIAGIELIPAPSNFTDAELAGNLSPLQCFNTIKLGLPGTAMISYSQLSDEEVWALSFYLLSMRFDEKDSVVTSMKDFVVPLDDASVLSENEIIEKFNDNTKFSLNQLRNYRLPEDASPPMQKAIEYLDLALLSYQKGAVDDAIDLSLKAYLEGIEPFESRIGASDSKLLGSLERKMMAVRANMKDGTGYDEVNLSVEAAKIEIAKGQDLLGSQERSMGFIAFLSASILIREGLEAFLIIIAILSILRSLHASRAIRWVHGGWITAVLIGGIAWFFVDSLMNWDVQNREMLEGLIALFAVLVLLYMGFWLHSKTEISKWKTFVEERIKVLVTKNNLFGLGAFAFIVVFREAFESVIFLSSLRVEAGSDGSSGIWIGIVVAALIVFLLSWGILKIFDKIPLRKVFLYSSLIIVALAVILTGDGIHALQEGGMVSATSTFFNVRLPLLGIYPTFECLGAQLLTFVSILGLWFYNKRKVTR